MFSQLRFEIARTALAIGWSNAFLACIIGAIQLFFIIINWVVGGNYITSLALIIIND